MNLEGIKWGQLPQETKEWLLENCNCIDGSTGNEVMNGECIVDLTEELSVIGKIIKNHIIIDDDSIIYNPENGVIDSTDKEINFILNEVMTVNEAAEMWGITEGAIRAAIKSRKFILGIEYRKAGRITLITKEAMEKIYGNLNI